MNRPLIAVMLAVAACSAHAQQTAPPTESEAALQRQAPPSDAGLAAPESSEGPNCLRYTGSRVDTADSRRAQRSRGKRCVDAAGRAYDREALDSTGESDPARALQKLDPSISIRR